MGYSFRIPFICLVVVCFIVICECVPVDRTDMEYVRKNNKVFDEFVSETGHNIVRRSKRRHGIIHGHLCPTGTGRLYGTQDCVPCNGYVDIKILRFTSF